MMGMVLITIGMRHPLSTGVETHVIIISSSHPWEDSGVDSSYVDSSISTDVLCDNTGLIWTRDRL